MEKLYDHETRERIDNDSRINEIIRETRNTNNINPWDPSCCNSVPELLWQGKEGNVCRVFIVGK